MKSLVKIIFSLFLMTVLISSCTDPNDPQNIDTGGGYATIRGKITNESGQPVSMATVKVGTVVVTTSYTGEYVLRNIIPSKKLVVEFSKSGYLTTYKNVQTINGVVSISNASLIKTGISTKVSATASSTVKTPDNAEVSFTANSFVDKNGTAISSGEITVEATFLNTADNSFYGSFPGDFTGVRTDASETMIESFGAINVELFDENNNPVNLAAGKKATIKLPIAAMQSGKAPDQIPLWYFDEKSGRWIEEGIATKSGNYYIGEVAHFSTWNCDRPAQTSYLRGNVVTIDGDPLVHASIRSEGVDYTGSSWAMSNGEGVFVIPVMSNSTAKLKAYFLDQVSNEHTFTSPNTGDTLDIGTIEVPVSWDDYCMITGKLLDIADNPLTNVLMYDVHNTPGDSTYLHSQMNDQGEFSFYKKRGVEMSLLFKYRHVFSDTVKFIVPDQQSHDLGNIRLNYGGCWVIGKFVDKDGKPLEFGYFYLKTTDGTHIMGNEKRELDDFEIWINPNLELILTVFGPSQQKKEISFTTPGLGETLDLGDIVIE